MPQLQINQGPQDALLYDNNRSYFTNVGYVRTSNFQMEYRDVDAQNTPALGSTVQFVIPKAADLLGPVDLRVALKAPTEEQTGLDANTIAAATHLPAFQQWVDEVGFAMIEKITFSVGSNDIETITGEQMQIKNELMTSDEMRLGYAHTLKTGRKAFDDETIGIGEYPGLTSDGRPTTAGLYAGSGVTKTNVNKNFTRLIAAGGNANHNHKAVSGVKHPYISEERHLIIPLNFFFTKHVAQYFPLAAVAGCNDIRIAVKFRRADELIQYFGSSAPPLSRDNSWISNSTKLRCHYVHVTGPEAQLLMNKEHVRLLKLWQHQHTLWTPSGGKSCSVDLSFLHPVSTLIITIRRQKDIIGTPTTYDTAGLYASDGTLGGNRHLGHFFYHGDGTDPNYDSPSSTETVTLQSIQLTLNGQERHPGLDKGIDVEYLQNRLLPMLHSNSNQKEQQYLATSHATTADRQRYAMEGSKNIYVYPFSLNPEGSNPSGAVNMSKVSHARLNLNFADKLADGTTDPASTEYRIDVYALYYNWLQIKDGRALLSFA